MAFNEISVLGQDIMGGSMGGSKNIIGAATSAVFLAGAGVKAFAKVAEGELGVRTSLGRATRPKDAWIRNRSKGELYGIVQPGYKLIMPFTHSIKTVSVQDRNHELGMIEVMDNENQQMKVDSALTWAVRADGDNPYRALFKVESQDSLTRSVADMCTAGLRTVMAGKSESQMNDSRVVGSEVIELCSDDLLEYGVEMRQLLIKTVTPTFGQMIVRASEHGHVSPATIASLPVGMTSEHQPPLSAVN